MYRYFISFAYNGKNFCGWQVQENAKSVQQALVDALKLIFKTEICIQGAGRTDTGVHASFFVAHFDTDTKIDDLEKIAKSLNGILKKDIVVFDIFEVTNDFHSRFSAISRTYTYFVLQQKNVFLQDFALYFKYPLDIEKMNSACEILQKHNDFACFQKTGSDVENSLCNVLFAKWQKSENMLVFTIQANRFLRNMVRSIVGTMLDVGQNKISVSYFEQIILSKNRSNAGISVDAQGLFLTDIVYPSPVNDLLEESRKKAKFIFSVDGK